MGQLRLPLEVGGGENAAAAVGRTHGGPDSLTRPIGPGELGPPVLYEERRPRLVVPLTVPSSPGPYHACVIVSSCHRVIVSSCHRVIVSSCDILRLVGRLPCYCTAALDNSLHPYNGPDHARTGSSVSTGYLPRPGPRAHWLQREHWLLTSARTTRGGSAH